jgi:hypothetical protein
VAAVSSRPCLREQNNGLVLLDRCDDADLLWRGTGAVVNRSEAISYIASLAEKGDQFAGSLEEGVNWPETIKNVLFDTENHDHRVEDKMVEALSALTALPQEKIAEENAVVIEDQLHRFVAAMTAARRFRRFRGELRGNDREAAEREAIDLLIGDYR